MIIKYKSLLTLEVETDRDLTEEELKDLKKRTISIFDLNCVDFEEETEIDREITGAIQIFNKNNEIIYEDK